MPTGKNLQPIMVEANERRKIIRQKAIQGVKDAFPFVGNNYEIHVDDVDVQPQDYSSEEQKQTILSGKSLVEPIKGRILIKDKSGKIIDKSTRPLTLLNLPWFTDRHTFVVGGNEYAVSNQIRLKPGVYTRRRANDVLESSFNLAKAAGQGFAITMDPDTGHFKMEYGTTSVPLYPILHAFGISNTEISDAWEKARPNGQGKELADSNRKAYESKEEQYINKLYEKIVPTFKRKEDVGTAEKVQILKDYYAGTEMDPEVVNKTLGVAHSAVLPSTLLQASEKLLRVFNGSEEPDDRDSLEFKRLHSVDDFIKERIALDTRKLRSKYVHKLNHTAADKVTVKNILGSSVFTGAIHGLLTNSDVSSTPTQYNPIEILDVSQRVSPLGEGGIGEERAIPMEARRIHMTHIGILDPVRTTESSGAGVDVRAAIHTRRDENGDLYAMLHSTKSNKIQPVSAKQISESVIAFPDQDLGNGGKVHAIDKGKLRSVSAKEVDYIIPYASSMYSPATNLVPLIESMQGNRALMAAKMQTQALGLIDREAPLVQVGSYLPGYSMEQLLARSVIPRSPVVGTVHKIDPHYIYIRPHSSKNAEEKEAAKVKDEDLVKVPYDSHFPLATKTFLHNNVIVNTGDKVKKDQFLTDSNFTVGDTLALGKNLKVALMAYKGLNSNDAIIISESAAKKLTSEHMYKDIYELDPDTVVGKNFHKSYYGKKYTDAQYSRLDDDGVIKKGEDILPGELIFAAMKKTVISPTASLLGKLNKSLVKPYVDSAHTWEHSFPGKIMDVVKTPTRWAITVLTKEPMVEGDKLTGRHGNKGIISSIIPDNQMIRDESDEPIDVLMTSAGVISRINPSQVIEMALAKVAQKTGKSIVLPAFSGHSNVEYAKKLLKDNGLSDKETVTDPVTGKKIKGIMVGPQYILKLMKTTETNYSEHGLGPYDVNEQPSRGGEEGSKALGRMEVMGLLAHGARGVLYENSVLKSNKNDDFWRALRLGLPPPTLKPSFAWNKFGAMLAGSGIKLDKVGGKIYAGSLTDADIKKMSAGAIKEPLFVRAKDLRPEVGGLFDLALTGGLQGTKFSHIELHEPIVNPVFEEPARRLLGLTGNKFHELIAENGAGYIKSELAKLNLDEKEKKLRELSKTARGAVLDDIIKQLHFIQALNKQKLSPDKAYVISNVPVIPPAMRQVVPGSNGNLQISDANHLYRDLMLANDKLQEAKTELTPEFVEKARLHLYDAASALFGLSDPVSPQAQQRGLKGFIRHIAGTGGPKTGYFHNKLIKKQLDLSGRGTIAPDINLGMDEIGLPEDMLWKVYEPFIVRRLVKRGYQALQAKEMIEAQHPAARHELIEETKERPVIYNRAPSLHRYNLIGAYPRPVPGKTIRLPATWSEPLMNADFDGDAIQVHVPVTRDAVEDVKNITIPNLLFSDKEKGRLQVLPMHEAVMGAYKATSIPMSTKAVKKFKSAVHALESYRRGEVEVNDPVEIED